MKQTVKKPFIRLFRLLPKNSFALLLVLWVAMVILACGVPQWKREYLSDPIMQLEESPDTGTGEEEFLNHREGGTSGDSGAEGGCGC